MSPKPKTMTAEEYRAHAKKNRFKTEAEFEKWIISVLKVNGWMVNSMHDSRRQTWGADSGYPDITAVSAEKRKLMFAELKLEKGRLSAKQNEWLQHLRTLEINAALSVGVMVLRPEDCVWFIQYAGGKEPLV